ncbi:MAG: DHH family phosphoesterase, partial [Chloroflexota bacterium]
MPLDGALIDQLAGRLEQAQRVLVVSHIRPDGDAIGSLLGWGLALQASGRQVEMISEDGVPSSLRHLPGAGQVTSRPKGQAFDLVCVVDCSDLERTGGVLTGRGSPDVNIDHHPTNLNFAALNLVDIQAVATAEIVAGIIGRLQLPMNPDVAAALVTGLITDTIGFRTSNVTPNALRLAAGLMEQGVDLPDLYR